MSQEKQKPVTGSNEHHAEIDGRIASLESQVSGLTGTLSTANSLISSLQNSNSILTTRTDELLKRVQSLERSQPLTSQALGTTG